MHKTILVSPLIFALSHPVLAQSDLSNLRSALAATPEIVLTNPEPFQFIFFDTGAWRDATGELAPAQASMRINFGDMIAPLAALRMAGADQWQERAGMSLDDVAWFAGFGSAPHAIAYWGFSSDASLTALVQTLQTRDFEYVGESDILGNGEPQAINITQRDPASPWRGSVGQASFIQAQDNVLLQSSSVPEAIEHLRPVTAPLVDSIVVATALTGLEAILPDDASVLQSLLVSPALGLAAFDPAQIISPTSSIEETKAKLEAAMAAAGQGIPPYFGGMLADLNVNGRSGLAISLTYPDCNSAKQAVERILASWNANLETDLPADKSDLTVAGADGFCAAALIFTSSDEVIDLAGQIYGRILRRDLSLLQIGTAS